MAEKEEVQPHMYALVELQSVTKEDQLALEKALYNLLVNKKNFCVTHIVFPRKVDHCVWVNG